mmetsp:Transcript_24107/g.50572  ORF Transcript_24107/g.50572 Transcript_24107/m.50572 type:complete len:838 (-) Transcript_24107:605-3118(-)
MQTDELEDEDWFSGHASIWEAEDGPLGDLHRASRQGERLHVLEVGVWKGRSTEWLLQHLCNVEGSKLVSIDHFDNARTRQGLLRYKRVLDRSRGSHALDLRHGFSSQMLLQLRLERREFDFAYIDASHHRLETLEDAIQAWRCLRVEGILCFDDYLWDGAHEHGGSLVVGSMDHPQRAIDAFIQTVEPEASILHQGYQVFLRKCGQPRHAVEVSVPARALLPAREFVYEVGIMLPLRCTVEWPVSNWVRQLNRSFQGVRAKLFIGVDEDDSLWKRTRTEVEQELDMPYSEYTFPPTCPAIICPIWASLARRAFDDGCAYLVLWGDDVSVEPANWFGSLRNTLSPFELGCVAPVDACDPSVPTFPIVTAEHFRVFDKLFDERFINQDADPYLYELYRRVGRARMIHDVRVINGRGGPATHGEPREPRYVRAPFFQWKQLIEPNAEILMHAVESSDPAFLRPLSIDVVIPSFRTPTRLLHSIVSIADPPGCTLRFILIIDQPDAPNLPELLALQSTRTRVRVNAFNMGASAARSRGLEESSAEWVLFIDDDVELNYECISAYAARVREAHASGNAFCGFVGTTKLPQSESILYEATRMSNITFFYNLPHIFASSVPWGVTANLLVRRTESMDFDTIFAKTGGGEDVDYCIRLQNQTGLPLGRAHNAIVIHEWWPAPSAYRYLLRFWKWTMGDGFLMYKHPQHVYLCFPNVIELTMVWILVGMFSPCSRDTVMMVATQLSALWAVELGFETVQALCGPESRHLSSTWRLAAAMGSGIVKNVVDLGHTAFHLRNGRPLYLLHRFDWFLGVNGGCSLVERKKFAIRCCAWALTALMISQYWP